MHFTVSFSGPEALDLSLGLVFMACPIWVQQATLNARTSGAEPLCGCVRYRVKRGTAGPRPSRGPNRSPGSGRY